MARECLDKCPYVMDARRDLAVSNYLILGGASLSLSDAPILSVEDAISESIKCLGPRIEIVDARRGIIHRRIVQEVRIACGLDKTPIATGRSASTQS